MLKKYNRQGPRYTSYPPVPFWRNSPTEESWITHLQNSYDNNRGVDLYIHVPFCEKLCFYCGCNRQITKNHSVENQYVELILKEWKVYCDQLGFRPKINSLHFGGGTPTFLSADNLEKIIAETTVLRTDSFLGSIELDPRSVTIDHIEMLINTGFKRFSLGIQDFNNDVQKAINRFQSYELVEKLVNELRLRKVESINFDVIYGLPKQTKETIEETFNLVKKLMPDQISYYSYAHLPEKLVNQRLINQADLPDAETKIALYESGKKALLEARYFDVGMDHFSLENNFLYQAKTTDQLLRNFMGYTDKKSNILIGLGPSAISDSSLSFIQNAKTMSDYQVSIHENKLSIAHGHTHDEMDKMAEKNIMELMCKDQTVINSKLVFYNEIVRELTDFENDGILTLENNKIQILPIGKKFIRNVAMTFDFYFRNQINKKNFSTTV